MLDFMTNDLLKLYPNSSVDIEGLTFSVIESFFLVMTPGGVVLSLLYNITVYSGVSKTKTYIF